MNTTQTDKSPINIFVVVHDDVPPSAKQDMHVNYFAHLADELQSFTDRKVNVIYGAGAPYSRFEYKGDNALEILQRWKKLAEQYLAAYKNEGFIINRLSLVLLFTKDAINGNTSGAALVDLPQSNGQFAISSGESYLYPAHEIGHLLGAKHQNFEVNYNGWWCETYMAPNAHLLRTNCYKYSPENREAIKNYLATLD
ncbi:hypothetical protein [Pseudomonas sp. MYb118]|uniref:hypothetical protein n=1 Tax=Pseudomonas sp. MYb118 TaxID=1848720 RepID=UPI0034CD51D6